jgi:trans-aconitate methyltransferase
MQRLWADAEVAYKRRILDALPQNSAANLLDVGCDDGAWTDELRRRLGIPAQQVFGLEIVPSRVELARARGFDVRSGDLELQWPFADQSMNVVHANQVIEHVKRLDHFVSEITRVLAPGGVTVVCTENLASWHNIAALALGYQPFSLTNLSNRGTIGNPFALHAEEAPVGESWQHIHVVTLRALSDLFDAHGLVVEDVWGTGYHPFPGRAAARLAQVDPWHAHFIGLVARSADPTAGAPRLSSL